MSPQIFHGVEFRCIGGKKLQEDATFLPGDELIHQTAAMTSQSVPDDQQFSGNVAQKVGQKLHHLWASDGAREQTEIEVPPRHTRHCRQRFPVEVKLQHRSLSSRSPGSASMRTLAQTTLIDENYCPVGVFGVFFTTGQRRRFQRRIAPSSRSKARPVGRWMVHPNFRRIRQAWPGWYSTPKVSLITSAKSHDVQSLVSYPAASGPRWRMISIRRRSSSLRQGFRPARPAFFKLGRPDSESCLAHRYTDCRWTPSRRETSAWLRPLFKSRAASNRLSSKASKSRRTPAGFPMQRTIAGEPRIVNYIM